MGISRDSRHKKRATGGRQVSIRKKRAYEKGRPPANTKLGSMKVKRIRVHGGNHKVRAIRLDHGNFAWGAENCTRAARIVDVVYNAANIEFVRTKTLVKNTIVTIDAGPFKAWYLMHYGVDLGKKKVKDTTKTEDADKDKDKETTDPKKVVKTGKKKKVYDYAGFKHDGPDKASRQTLRKWINRSKEAKMDTLLRDSFLGGRLLACIASRPGQVGHADGYVLDGKELEFYKKKLKKKKKKKKKKVLCVD
eukprot:Platyproteum_vivax@DN13927_c0_g1_i3.p1